MASIATSNKATAIGSTMSIYIHKSKSSYIHTLEYTFKSYSGTIVEKTSASAYSWVVPTDFYYELTDTGHGIATLHCITYDGDTVVGTTHSEFEVYASQEAAPTTNPTVTDSNSVTVALTGNANNIVRYRSTALVSINATAKYGATIASQKIVNGSMVFPHGEASYGNVDNPYYSYEVIDSRGLSTAGDIRVNTDNWITYSLPSCNIKSNKPDAYGNITVECSGYWWSKNFGATDNTLTAQYRYKVDGGSYSDWVSMNVSAIIGNDNYTATANLTGLDYRNVYVIQTRVVDKLSTTVSAEYKARAIPVFSWSKDDFEFNVPVSFSGETMVDFVVEQGTEAMGTNGTWYWRKWHSGKSECYGCRNFGNAAVSTAWGSLYRSEAFSQSLPSGLFNAIPDVIDISFRGAVNYGAWIARHETSGASTTNTGSFIIVRPASATLTPTYVCFNIIGRWK